MLDFDSIGLLARFVLAVFIHFTIVQFLIVLNVYGRHEPHVRHAPYNRHEYHVRNELHVRHERHVRHEPHGQH